MRVGTREVEAGNDTAVEASQRRFCPRIGSEKNRDCCCQRLPGSDMGERYFIAIKERPLERALERALLLRRAEIVQYAMWHKTNAEPSSVVMNLLLSQMIGCLVFIFAQIAAATCWIHRTSSHLDLTQHPVSPDRMTRSAASGGMDAAYKRSSRATCDNCREIQFATI